MKHSKWISSGVVIGCFLLAYYGRRWFPLEVGYRWWWVAYTYAWYVVPPVLGTGFLFSFRELVPRLGLDKGIARALIFAGVSVLPMLLGAGLMGQMQSDIDVLRLLQGIIFAGFFEELLFRGFLFGLLFRYLGWGFVPAAALGALFFGLAHLYQGATLTSAAMIFLITAMGAAWFAWLYIEWENNLWVPIFLHILMNLSWALFEVSDSALGGLADNLFRSLTIAVTVIWTIRHNKKSKFRISRQNLWTSYKDKSR